MTDKIIYISIVWLLVFFNAFVINHLIANHFYLKTLLLLPTCYLGVFFTQNIIRYEQ